MALTILNPALDLGVTCFRDYAWVDDPDVMTWMRKGPGRQTGALLSPHLLRRYSWSMGVDEDVRRSWQTFLGLLNWIRAPFLIRDPRDRVRETTLEPTTGNGVLTTFALPTAETHADFPFWALNDGLAYGLVSGVQKQLASMDLDARTVTFATAPANAAVVGLGYQPLRLVALKAPPQVQSVAQVFSTTSMELQQLVRD